MSGPELKPCPFCDHGAEFVEAQGYPISGWRVHCDYCGAWADGKQWNRRAPVDYAALPEVQALTAAAEARALDSVTTLHMVIADIRAATVGSKPMLSELAQALVAWRDEAVRAEREACVAECQHRASQHENNGHYLLMREVELCAAAIRKRGEG